MSIFVVAMLYDLQFFFGIIEQVSNTVGDNIVRELKQFPVKQSLKNINIAQTTVTTSFIASQFEFNPFIDTYLCLRVGTYNIILF